MKTLPALFVTLIILLPVFSRAQYNQVNFYPPEAASLMRNVDYPVSHLTGMPDIQIPLHTIKAGILTLPVTLSFHLDNFIKANQMPGGAGAGWSLSTDIQISRAINGTDDLNPLRGGYCFTNTIPANYSNSYQTRTRIEKKIMVDGNADEEPDKFYYQLLGKSGSFYFQKQSNGTFIPVSVPLNGVKINYNFSTQQFTIIDTDGTTYLFSTSKTEWASSLNTTNLQILAWKCETIKNAAGVQEIAFSYANNYQGMALSYSDRVEVYDDFASPYDHTAENGPKCNGGGGFEVPPNPSVPFWQITGPKKLTYGGMSSSFEAYNHQGYFQDVGYYNDGGIPSLTYQNVKKHVLTGISFRGGSVVFNYTGQGQLTSLQIKNGTGTTIKSVDFSQSYTGSSGGTPHTINKYEHSRKLDSLKINDQKYSFVYGFERQYGNVTDFWGYEAAAPGSYCTVPHQDIDLSMGNWEYFYDCYSYNPTDISAPPLVGIVGSGPNANTIFDLSLGLTTALTITYPTGGRTEFLVGQNRFRDPIDQTIKGIGGYRIEKIRSFDGLQVNPVTEKIYKYGPDEDGTGIVKNIPSFDPYTGNCMLTEVNYYGVDPTAPSYFQTSARKRTYLSGSTRSLTFSSGSLVNYHTVTEYNSDMGTLTGKTVYKYDYYWYTPEYTSPTDPYPFEKNDWDRGMPDSVIYYKYQNGQFTWVKKKNMDYNTYTLPNKIYQGRASLRGNYILVAPSSYTQDGATTDYGNLEYKYSAIDIGAVQLTHEDEIEKDENGNTLTTSTNYFYTNPDPSLATRIETTGSDGIATVQHITYPGDYAAGGFITPLIANNIVSVPVEKVVRRDGKIVSGQVSTYNSNGSLVSSYQVESNSPLNQSSFKMSNRATAGDYSPSGTNTVFNRDINYTQKLSLDWDNYFNLKQVVPVGNMPTAYIWGYNNLYPVAEVANALTNEVLFNSFEEGGWDANVQYDQSFKHAGLASGRIEKPTAGELYAHGANWLAINLSATKKFRYSGWVYSNGPTVELLVLMKRAGETGYASYTDVVSTSVTGKWVFIEKEFTVPADVTQLNVRIDNNGGGNVWFDDIRLYPSAAQMTTYTYAPLIGMTSKADVNNRFVYYEYDGFGRLTIIRDQDGNIIKKIDYKYNQQY